jgi:DNA invertase Pin-like site-specific DNA recombinase
MQETELLPEVHTPHRIGYARVSTADQNPQMQVDALLADGVLPENLYSERVSGAAKKRPTFAQMMREIRADDVVTVWKLDRLGRTLRQVLGSIDTIHKRGAHLRILTQQLDTSTPMGKCMLAMIAAFSELERDLAIERTKAGLIAAAARGRVGGRRQQYADADIERAAEMFRRGGLTLVDAAQHVRNRQGRAITAVQLRRRIDLLEKPHA